MPEVVDDLFQESTPTIVDCDILEAAKENVQPLASGRRVTALSAILSTPHAARDSKLSATRNRLRINVELALDDSEDDPLEAYCRLVYWTVDNYPQGHSAESGLLELLEEATRVLKDDRDGMWRDELKYLKLWVLYASFVEKPTVIYKFLLVNNIGTNHALFYEEYALALERSGSRSAADKIYSLGVARQAEPSDRLHSRYREFQKRMMTAAPLPEVAPAPQPLAPPPKRVALRTTSVSSTPSITPAPSSSRPNGRLQVFVDPSGEDSAADGNEWSELGSRKTRVKENVPETRKMTGTKIKQSGKTQRLASASKPSSSSKIVPFRDPVPGDDTTEMPPPSIIPSTKAKGKARDDAKPTPSRSPFVPFTDEPPAPAPTKSSVRAGGPFVPFKDDAPPAKPVAKGKFVPFQDEEAKAAPPKTPAKSSFTPFKDDTPAFTPFRDGSPSSARTSAPDSVMKAKTTGHQGSSLATEAEALRKDPLKNYGCDVDLGDDGLP
ncbi:hypothetical protein ONZ45_g12090 [Pleurotus djamor]|nr:hypothetical protein ONZ45_g12090 [Pleurotus djamor]